MLAHFSIVLALLVIATLFIFVSLIMGKILRPKTPNKVKSEIYECGEKAIGSTWINFNIRFYLIALIFVIFDVEVALIFPVATVFKKWVSDGNGIVALIEILVFILVLLVGFVYAWAMKDLKWIKPETESLN
mgnify:CR=1 FL=1